MWKWRTRMELRATDWGNWRQWNRERVEGSSPTELPEEPPVWLLTSAIVTEEIFVSHHEICGLLVQSLYKI